MAEENNSGDASTFPETHDDWRRQSQELQLAILSDEKGEEAYARGPLDGGKDVALWWSYQAPAVRANVYVALAGMAFTDPTVMTDLEVALHAFASQDDMAMKAVERGQVQAIELDGDVDENGVLTDEDWYVDHIHFGGDPNRSREVLSNLYGAGMLPGEDHGSWVGAEQSDNVMQALESGWNLDVDDDKFGRGRISDQFKSDNFWEDRLSNFFETLDIISNISQVVAPIVGVVGSVPMGAAPATGAGGVPGVGAGFLKPPMAVRPAPTTAFGRGVLNAATALRLSNPEIQRIGIKTNPAVQRNMATVRYGQVLYSNTYGKTPNYMRPWTYASLRTGTPLRGVIQNAATSDQGLRRPVGQGMEWALSNRGKVGVGVTMMALMGSAIKVGVQVGASERFEGGGDDVRAEQEARDAGIADKQIQKRDYIEAEGPAMARNIVESTLGQIGVQEGEEQ